MSTVIPTITAQVACDIILPALPTVLNVRGPRPASLETALARGDHFTLRLGDIDADTARRIGQAWTDALVQAVVAQREAPPATARPVIPQPPERRLGVFASLGSSPICER